MIRAHSKLWLEDEQGNYLMGPRTARLLAAIELHGSLAQAAKATGFSYRAAWNRLRRVEQALGYPLVETTVGGPGGGGTTLSKRGKRLVSRFCTLQKEVEALLEEAFAHFDSEGLTR